MHEIDLIAPEHSMKYAVVGTAGHIDHGKSALVQALTGTNPDRLEEEKRRGITIDLGFAFLDLGGVRLGFVDVPGHERFIRNMLAGVGGVDLALLVIAADESIKPQTREHFDICRLLGIERGIVALTKSDLVDEEILGLVRLEIEDFVRGSFLESAPILPVSARTGAGIDALKREMLNVVQGIRGKKTAMHFRLPIDRVFAMRGFGTVVTGTLVSGALNTDDEAEIYPGQKQVRVRGLQSAGQPVKRAIAGQRIAVNLAGVERGEIRRGMALAPSGAFEASRRCDCRLALLPSAGILKNHARVHFYQGTAETIAEVRLLGGRELAPGESMFAQMSLSDPVLLLPGDRFIIRQFSPLVTIGGGAILDPLARKRLRNDVQVAPFLELLECGDRDEILSAFVARSPKGISSREIVARTGWLESEIAAIATKLSEARRVRMISDQPLTLASQSAIEHGAAEISKAVDAFHRLNPLSPGVPKQDLRGRFEKFGEGVFQTALDDLISRHALTSSGDLILRAGREVALTPEEARAKEIIEGEFARAGLSAPSFEDVLKALPVEAARARKILQILLRDKTLIRITPELVFHHSAVARLRNLLADYKEKKGERLPIPAFKDLTAVSRKYAIPLLEYLDREGVTRRVGNERVIIQRSEPPGRS